MHDTRREPARLPLCRAGTGAKCLQESSLGSVGNASAAWTDSPRSRRWHARRARRSVSALARFDPVAANGPQRYLAGAHLAAVVPKGSDGAVAMLAESSSSGGSAGGAAPRLPMRLRGTNSCTRRGSSPELEYAFHSMPSSRGLLHAAFSRTEGEPFTFRSWWRSNRLFAHRLGEQVDRLAHHALRGELWDKRPRLPSGRDQGRRALRLRQAVAYFEQSLAALKTSAREPRTIAQAIDLRWICATRSSRSESTASLRLPCEGEALAERTSDQHRLGLDFRLYLCPHFLATTT